MMLASTLVGLGQSPVAASCRGGLAPWQVQRVTEMMAVCDGAGARSASRWANSVTSEQSCTRAISQSWCGTRTGLRCPPVRASSFDHSTTLDAATPNRLATTRQVDPDRTAATTRSRISAGYALVIPIPPSPDNDRESQDSTQGNPTRFSQTLNHPSGYSERNPARPRRNTGVSGRLDARIRAF